MVLSAAPLALGLLDDFALVLALEYEWVLDLRMLVQNHFCSFY